MGKVDLDELIEESEEAIKKGEDLSEVEADHHHKEKSKSQSSKFKLEDKIKEAKFNKAENPESKASEAQLPEVLVGEEKKHSKTKSAKYGKDRVRSKKYQAALAQIDAKKKYNLEDAIELVKKTTLTHFDGNVEVNIRLFGKSAKPEQARGLIKYPHETGRKIKVVILDEKIIDSIITTSKIAADIYLATPALMPRVGRLAKILGPKGKMPNPKAGTVTEHPEKTKTDLENGQTEYKTDSYGNIHQIIGKVSGKTEELAKNFKTLIEALPEDKITSINLSATMGPGVKVQK